MQAEKEVEQLDNAMAPLALRCNGDASRLAHALRQQLPDEAMTVERFFIVSTPLAIPGSPS